MWAVNNDSVCVHGPMCNTTSTPRISAVSVEKLVRRDVLSGSEMPIRIHAEQIEQDYGVKVAFSTICKAMQSVKGLEKSAQHTKLQDLGKLLQAFAEKNPNSVLHVEKDANNQLHRLFIRPGAHASIVRAMLGIVHSDTFHIKNKEFNFQIAASAVLTNQRSAFIYCFSIFAGGRVSGGHPTYQVAEQCAACSRHHYTFHHNKQCC
jgi:hypothetical protein